MATKILPRLWMMCALGAAALGLQSAEAAQGGATSFRFPEPVVHTEPTWNVLDVGVLGVRAIVPLDVQEKLNARHYSAQEHRNVQLAIDAMSSARSNPPKRAANFKPSKHPGFYVLHHAFGYPERNGFSAVSFMSRVQHIEDIIASGNRVVLVFRITGSVAGPMYGFKGVGQRIDMRESMRYEFNDAGEMVSMQPWSAEDLAFYEQLGGKLEFARGS